MIAPVVVVTPKGTAVLEAERLVDCTAGEAVKRCRMEAGLNLREGNLLASLAWATLATAITTAGVNVVAAGREAGAAA